MDLSQRAATFVIVCEVSRLTWHTHNYVGDSDTSI